jgi:hypothetical protein
LGRQVIALFQANDIDLFRTQPPGRHGHIDGDVAAANNHRAPG